MNQLELEQYNYLNELGQRLQMAKHGAKGALIDEAKQFLHCSKDKVYEHLNSLDLIPTRKKRSDKNTSKISPEECQLIGNILMNSRRDTGKKLLPVAVVTDILKENGKLSCDISAAHAGRMMKKHNVHPEQMGRATPHTLQRSLHPNHVWEFDVSVCVLFYLKGSTGLNIMPEDEFYKNKPANFEKISKERVLRYLVTDHYSGTLYVEYFVTSGENSETLFVFLMNAFSRHHKEDPFHGVPWILKLDKGTANMSHMIMHLLKLMHIKVIAHQAGNPRAKGQVEKTHDIVERHLEGRLSMQKINNVLELNAFAHNWMRVFNSKQVHSRHKRTRYGVWQTIKAEQLRIAPDREVCKRILQVTKPIVRPVNGDLCVSFTIKGLGTLSYSLKKIEHLNVGDEVTVSENPYLSPSVTVEVIDIDGEIKSYEIAPIDKDAVGFNVNAPVIGEEYKSLPDTPADKQRKAMNQQAYGVRAEADVKKARKKRRVAFDGEIDAFADVKNAFTPDYMQRKGHHMSVDAPHIETVRIAWAKAGKRIKRELDLDSQAMKVIGDIFKAKYPEGIQEHELANFIEEVSNETVTAKANAG